MGAYLIRRLLQAIPLLILVASLTFVLVKISGDPLQYLTDDPRVNETERLRLKEVLGLNDPLPLQFLTWLIGDAPMEILGVEVWPGVKRDLDQDGTGDVVGDQRGIVRGEFGESIAYNRPAVDVVMQKMPNTIKLGLASFFVTITVSLAVGIYAALHQYTFIDNAVTTASFIMFSMPIFLIALLCIYVFSVQFRLIHDQGVDWLRWIDPDGGKGWWPYLPVLGMQSSRRNPSAGSLTDQVWHMILPVFCLSAISIAGYSRYIRATMLEVLDSDYIRTARSKGLPQSRITFIHALKNASLPLVTLIALDLPFLIGGAVVTEQIFVWDGMGRMFIGALGALDAPIIVLFTLMIVISVVIFQLLADIMYAVLDPRVRYS